MNTYLFLLVFLLLSLRLTSQTGVTVPELTRFDSRMNDIVGRYDVHGAQLAITYHGRLVYNRGFGLADTTSRELVQPTSIFRLASVSKSITAIAIMKLVENGVLGLDDKVFGVKGILSDSVYSHPIDARVFDITVRQLLNHTAGFNYVFGTEPLWKTYDIALKMGVPPPTYSFSLVLQWALQNDSLGFAPGTTAWYSNFGYTLLGLVTEKITGLQYDRYVRDSVLAPLGITDMHPGRTLAVDKFPNEVHYYSFPGDTLYPSIFTGVPRSVPPQYGGYNWEIMTPAGGWVASAGELCKLLVAVDRFATKPDILQRSTIDSMTKPSQLWKDYAFGWFVNANEYWNNGGIQGSATTVECDSKNEISYAILFNTLPKDYTPFYNEFVHLVSNEFAAIPTWPTHDLFNPVSSAEGDIESTSISINPNPAADYLMVENYAGTLEIANDLGVVVWKGNVEPQQKVSVSHLFSGLYIVKAHNTVYKLIVQR